MCREDFEIELAEVDGVAGRHVAVPHLEPVRPAVAGHLHRVHRITELADAGGCREVALEDVRLTVIVGPVELTEAAQRRGESLCLESASVDLIPDPPGAKISRRRVSPRFCCASRFAEKSVARMRRSKGKTSRRLLVFPGRSARPPAYATTRP